MHSKFKSRCGHDYNNVKEGIPGQCINDNYFNNNLYECLDRSDEIPFNSIKEDFWFAINLKPCNNWCGGTPNCYECTRNNVTRCIDGWCNNNVDDHTFYDTGETCDEINGKSILDKKLCGNYTFWQNVPCITNE